MKPNLEQLIRALRVSWQADTAFEVGEWGADNPARGQCVVTSLIVQDYLGGDLQRYEVEGDGFSETHYANLLDGGVIVDMTSSQYHERVQLTPTPVDLKGFATIREKRLADKTTRARYDTLKRRVVDVLDGAAIK